MAGHTLLRDHKWGIYGIDLSEDQQSGKLGLSHPEMPLVVSDKSNALDPKFSPMVVSWHFGLTGVRLRFSI